jgi:hypothetical protein
MKTRLMTVVCFGALICYTIPAFTQNRLDVILQGPWILYVDKEFASPKTVLVAFTTGTDPNSAGNFPHNEPYFSTGNGTVLVPGTTYCVGFDHECAKQRYSTLPGPSVPGIPITNLTHDGYPQSPVLLPVHAQPGWKWSNHRTKYGSYIVFPMPDSYSNEGVFQMSLGAAFAKPGTPSGQPIGIQLHYDGLSAGATELELFDCGGSASAIDCKQVVNAQPNYGTLEVEMKAPRNENACDWHVRSAYSKMLSLIDPNNQYNQNIKYIDVPYTFPQIQIPLPGPGPVPVPVSISIPYYHPDCYACDEQNPNYRSECPLEKEVYASTMRPRDKMHSAMPGVKNELDKVVDDLKPFLNADNDLLKHLSDIQSTLSTVQSGKQVELLPTFSQLETLEYLLQEPVAADKNHEKFKAALLEVQNFASDVKYVEAVKDGKDCRAPIMQLLP